MPFLVVLLVMRNYNRSSKNNEILVEIIISKVLWVST